MAASTLYAVAPVAALVGWIALGEVPSPLTGVGGAIALCGVALTVRARRAPAPGAQRLRGGGRYSVGSSKDSWPSKKSSSGGRGGRGRATTVGARSGGSSAAGASRGGS